MYIVARRAVMVLAGEREREYELTRLPNEKLLYL
jgi:hypothetical protein